MIHRSLSATLSISAAMLLVLSACAPDDVETDSEPEATTEETVTETPEAQDPDDEAPEATETVKEQPSPEPQDTSPGPEETEQAEEPEPGPPEGPPSGGVSQIDDAELPGEETTPAHYSQAGAEVGIAGLDPDDAPREVRSPPGQEAELVAELQPTDAVVLAGRERNLHVSTEDDGQGLWAEVQLADGYGWVEIAPLHYFGATEDVTEDYIDEVPPTEEARALAESLGERATGGEPDQEEPEEDRGAGDYGPDWVVITEPEDYGEEFYRVDVTGQMDDSVAGHRYFVHVEEHADGYQLTQVEATTLCYRGVSDYGRCN